MEKSDIAETHYNKGWVTAVVHQSHDTFFNLLGSSWSYGIHRLPWASWREGKHYLSHTVPPCHVEFQFSHSHPDSTFLFCQGAEGIRGLKGGKGEKVNPSTVSSSCSAWLTDAIPLKMETCKSVSNEASSESSKWKNCLRPIRLAVKSSCHWAVMECGTLNQNEAVCWEVSVETDLLPLFSWLTVAELSLLLTHCHQILFPVSCQEIETLQRRPENTEFVVKSS